MIVEAEHDGALDGLAARRHRRVAVRRYLAVELLQVLDEGLLRLHAVGGAGEIVLRALDSAVDVTIAVQAGQLLPIRARFVRATGTTATGLVSLA